MAYPKRWVDFITRSETESRIKAMISLAKSEPGVPIRRSEFDSDPMLFNCANGTIDLRTGKLRSHRREDLITKLSPAMYDPEAKDDIWDKVIHDATGGDPELQTFLRNATGYSLTGETHEEVLFLVLGPQSTGKTTFLEAIKSALGDYAMTADFEALLSRRDVGGPRNDIARLAGARLVAASEVDEGKKFSHGLVKMLTGGDTITARKLYQEAFEFRPTFKLWLAANHAPKLRADDDAMWRRIIRVPFTHIVMRCDRRVKAHVRDVSKSGSAILAWMVQGCLDWQKHGLRVPQLVEAATADYRESQRPLRDFLSDCCLLNPAVWVSTSDLRSEYERWAKGRGDCNPLMGNSFTEELKAYGLEPRKRQNTRGWQGIGLSS